MIKTKKKKISRRVPRMVYVWIVFFSLVSALNAFSDESPKIPADTAKGAICPECGKPLLPGPSDAPADPADPDSPDSVQAQDIHNPTQDESLPATDSIINTPWVIYLLVGFLVILLLCIGGGLYYFLVLQPKKKRQSLVDAAKIIENDIEEQFEEAEKELEKAIVSGMKKEDVELAYFLLAYIKTRLEKYDQAATTINKADMASDDTLYLSLWLYVKLEEYKKAHDFYLKHSNVLNGKLDSDSLVSIACLYIGKEHWANREVDATISYFDMVNDLKIHSAHIPEGIGNHQVTLGLIALFDKHFEEAKKHFESAGEQAKKEGTSQIESQLGLLLCQWREHEYPQIDNELMDLDVAAIPSGKSSDDTLSDSDILKRNIYLWQAVSLIFSWLGKAKNSGLSENDFQQLNQRLEKVKQIDSRMGDPYFIIGILQYYFLNETSKEEAIENLKKSNVSVPEMDIVLKKENKLKEMEKKSLDHFLSLARTYLTDKSIPIELRQRLRDKMEGFAKFKKMASDISLKTSDDSDGPSLNQIQDRGKSIRQKINTIIRPKLKKMDGDETSKVFDTLLGEMEGTISKISKQTQTLEETSQELMINTSEFLFREEENMDDISLDAENGKA